jgi:hypothetical protein
LTPVRAVTEPRCPETKPLIRLLPRNSSLRVPSARRWRWIRWSNLDSIVSSEAIIAAGGSNTITLTARTTSPYVLTAVNSTSDGATGLPLIAANDNLTILGNADTIERSTAAGTPDFHSGDRSARRAKLVFKRITSFPEGYASWCLHPRLDG